MLSLLHSNVTSQCLHPAPHLIPSRTHYNISLTGRVNTVQKDHFERESPRPHDFYCSVSCSVVLGSFATPCTVARQAPLSVGFPSKNTGMGCHLPLQGIIPTQGLNPGLPHCRWILYLLSHEGIPVA